MVTMTRWLNENLPGVTATRVGYSGGDVPHATYRNHGTHAEAIEVVFDPTKLSYRELLEHVWGFEYIDDIDYLRVYIWHLRRKLEPNPKEPLYIINELGVGYRFERQD